MLKFNAEDAIVSESEKEREELKSEEEKKAKIAAELFDSALALLRSGHQSDIFFQTFSPLPKLKSYSSSQILTF